MATTTRAKRQTKQKAPIKEVAQAPTEKFLSVGELLALETKGRDLENAKLRTAIEEQALRNMTLEHVIMGENIKKQNALLHERHREYETIKSGFRSLKAEIMKAHGLEGKAEFGYDVLSGKIST